MAAVLVDVSGRRAAAEIQKFRPPLRSPFFVSPRASVHHLAPLLLSVSLFFFRRLSCASFVSGFGFGFGWVVCACVRCNWQFGGPKLSSAQAFLLSFFPDLSPLLPLVLSLLFYAQTKRSEGCDLPYCLQRRRNRGGRPSQPYLPPPTPVFAACPYQNSELTSTFLPPIDSIPWHRL